MPERSMPQGLQTETIAGVIDDEAVPNTEANTVADKSETSLPEGAFVVSKAGVDEAGEIDLIERIIKPAIAALAKEGITIKLEDITQPAKQLNGGVDVALSEGEMIIPPALARKIGLGLLRKINDRGKKETEEKIQETQTAEQAPQEQAPQEQAQAPIRANKGGKIDKNLDMLARILFSEAGVEGKAGMQAVANVVMNRIEDTTAGFKNLKEANKVISQKGAFSSYGNKDYNNPSGPNYDIAKQVARQALSKEGLEDITGGALHFRNPDIREKDNSKAATEKEQKFFDDQMKSGRYILSKIIGKHHFYVDDHSDVVAGKDTKIESFADMQIPEEQQLGADTSSIDADPEQPPADDYESDAARRKRTIGEYTPEQRVPFAN
jgi:spore germination cell wall hydrolase CwlJ-like protein